MLLPLPCVLYDRTKQSLNKGEGTPGVGTLLYLLSLFLLVLQVFFLLRFFLTKIRGMQNNNKASKAQSGLFCFWKVWHEWWNMEECTCLVSLCSSGSCIHCCCLPILTFTLEQLRWGLENFQGIQLSYLFLKKLDYICKLTSGAPVDAGAHCWRQFSCVCPFIDNELSNLSLSTLTGNRIWAGTCSLWRGRATAHDNETKRWLIDVLSGSSDSTKMALWMKLPLPLKKWIKLTVMAEVELPTVYLSLL